MALADYGGGCSCWRPWSYRLLRQGSGIRVGTTHDTGHISSGCAFNDGLLGTRDLSWGSAVAACVLVRGAKCPVCTEICSDEQLPGVRSPAGACVDT